MSDLIEFLRGKMEKEIKVETDYIKDRGNDIERSLGYLTAMDNLKMWLDIYEQGNKHE